VGALTDSIHIHLSKAAEVSFSARRCSCCTFWEWYSICPSYDMYYMWQNGIF